MAVLVEGGIFALHSGVTVSKNPPAIIKLSKYDLSIEREKKKIIACESGGKHDGVWGDNRKAYGVAQFHRVLFDELKIKSKNPKLKWKNKEDQLWLLDWALRNGYSKKWSCSSVYKK